MIPIVRIAITVLGLAFVVGAGYAEERRVPLPEEVRAALLPLGEGVVGEPVDAKPIDDPAALRHLAEGTWTYRIVAGPNVGQTQRVRVEQADTDDDGVGFRVETGDEDIQTLVVTSDHQIVKLSQTDLGSDRTVVYRPGLVLDPGMAVGESKTVERKISTYKKKRPDKVEYDGSLRYTTRYLGAYRIETPAGRFDARLLEHQYEMQIGPASAYHQSYGFYADGVGNVAEVSQERVKAVLLYRRSSETARVLTEKPER